MIAGPAAGVRSRLSCAGRSEHGAVTLFVAIAVVGLLALAGLVVDGGAKVRAVQRADRVAAEAARAAGQAIDLARVLEGSDVRVDRRAAIVAAESYLRASGVEGSARVIDGGSGIAVTTTTSAPTVFLGLIGVPQFTVRGKRRGRPRPLRERSPSMSATTDQHDAGPRRVGRALAALGALAVLIAVVPVVLVALTQALPLDLGALSPAAWGHADDGRILLLAIVMVAWFAWAVMVFSIGLETWAAVRRVPTPTLPGMAVPQRLAAGLVAAVLVALSPAPGVPAIGAPVASPESGPTGVVAVVAAASFGADRIEIDELREPSLAPQRARRSLDQSMSRLAAPTVTTERHDTLWLLAEQYLGAGERYMEIVELNQGVRQSDGRSLGDDGRIYPGWTLALPADAAVDAVRPERHAVVPGDTLWEIAGDELGDPTRYPEIAEANRGDLQPDGRHLTDADLILPGWVLELPGTTHSEARSEVDRSEVDGPGVDRADPPRRRTRPPRAGIPVNVPAPRFLRRRTRRPRPMGPPVTRPGVSPVQLPPRHRPRWRRSTGPGRPRGPRRARPTRRSPPSRQPRPAGRWMPPRACRPWIVRRGLGLPLDWLGRARTSS